MDTEPTYVPLGRFSRTHGFDGLLVLESDRYLPDGTADLEALFVVIDGLPVPFFPEEFRFKADNMALVRFKDVTPAWSVNLVGCDVVCTEKDWEDICEEDEEDDIPAWIGFQVLDAGKNPAGVITDIEDYNGNIVLSLDTGHGTCLVPFHEDLLKEADPEHRTLTLIIPDGLLDDAE